MKGSTKDLFVTAAGLFRYMFICYMFISAICSLLCSTAETGKLFFVKGQRVNISSFLGHRVVVATSLLCTVAQEEPETTVSERV